VVIIWSAIEIFVNFFQMFIVYKSFYLFYEQRHKNKHAFIIVVIFMTTLLSIVNHNVVIKDNILIYLSLYVLLYFTTIVIFKGNMITKAIQIFGILFVMFLCELTASAIVMIIIDSNISKVYEQGFYRLTIMTISQTMFFYIYIFIKNKTYNKHILFANKKYFIIISLILFVNLIALTIVIWMYANIEYKNNLHIIIITICISALSILELILFYNIFKNSILEAEKDKLLFQYEIGNKCYAQINNILEDMRIIKHNLKNSLIIIDTYNKNNQKEKLQKYVDELLGETSIFVVPQIDEENIITSYLSYKTEQAEANEIKVDVENNLTNSIKVDKTDICQVIGNIMDNAIEANSKNINKYIKILLYNKDNYMIIKSENPAKEPLFKKNNEFLTTKKDSKNHGLGLKSIKKIAEKYDGSLDINITNETFQIKVVFLNE